MIDNDDDDNDNDDDGDDSGNEMLWQPLLICLYTYILSLTG